MVLLPCINVKMVVLPVKLMCEKFDLESSNYNTYF
jgi:hypothetical protein